MVQFVPDHLKTKKMSKDAVKILPEKIDIRLSKCVIKLF